MNFDEVFAAYHAAYISGALESVDARVRLLRALNGAIMARQKALYNAFEADLHKCREQVFQSELMPVLNEIAYFTRNAKALSRSKAVHQPMLFWNARSRLLPRPIGPVLVIAPFNYPFYLAMGPLIGALACGCPVTLHMSPQTPAVRRVVREILEECVAPSSGFLRSLYASGAFCAASAKQNAGLLGQAIISMQDSHEGLLPRQFGCVFFTGSVPVGKIIQEQCAKYLCRCVLELGGCNPIFLSRSANVKQAAEQICLGKFLNAGQTCIAPNFVLAERGCEEHIAGLIREIKRQYVSSEHCCKVINQAKYEQIRALLESRKIVYAHQFPDQPGDYLGSSKGSLESQLIFPPTLIEVQEDDPILKMELFANLLPIVYFDSHQRALEYYQNTFFRNNPQARPLAAYLFSEEQRQIENFPRQISAGTCSVNQCLLFVISYLPFGGVGESGLGRYHGEYSTECFTHYQPVHEVAKRYMCCCGYAMNSFGVQSSAPPFPKMSECMTLCATRTCMSCTQVSIMLLVLLVLWAVAVTAGLVYVLVK